MTNTQVAVDCFTYAGIDWGPKAISLASPPAVELQAQAGAGAGIAARLRLRLAAKARTRVPLCVRLVDSRPAADGTAAQASYTCFLLVVNSGPRWHVDPAAAAQASADGPMTDVAPAPSTSPTGSLVVVSEGAASHVRRALLVSDDWLSSCQWNASRDGGTTPVIPQSALTRRYNFTLVGLQPRPAPAAGQSTGQMWDLDTAVTGWDVRLTELEANATLAAELAEAAGPAAGGVALLPLLNASLYFRFRWDFNGLYSAFLQVPLSACPPPLPLSPLSLSPSPPPSLPPSDEP